MNISILFFIIAIIFFCIAILVQIPILIHIGKKEDYHAIDYFWSGAAIDMARNFIKDRYGDSKSFSTLLMLFRTGLIGFAIFFIIYLILNGGSELPIS